VTLDDVLARLEAYRDARSGIHAAIREAAALGVTRSEIARRCGMTRAAVQRILARDSE
jgi:DNA-binding transcriptional regulator LsrR (DeoR family)